MKITIQTYQVLARKSLLAYVQEKVETLADPFSNFSECVVTLKIDRLGAPEDKICMIRIAVPDSDLFAEKRAANFEEAVLRAVDAIREQIVGRKEKICNNP